MKQEIQDHAVTIILLGILPYIYYDVIWNMALKLFDGLKYNFYQYNLQLSTLLKKLTVTLMLSFEFFRIYQNSFTVEILWANVVVYLGMATSLSDVHCCWFTNYILIIYPFPPYRN